MHYDLRLKELKSMSIKEGLSFTNLLSQVVYGCIVLCIVIRLFN